jgi:hypothetical protein
MCSGVGPCCQCPHCRPIGALLPVHTLAPCCLHMDPFMGSCSWHEQLIAAAYCCDMLRCSINVDTDIARRRPHCVSAAP